MWHLGGLKFAGSLVLGAAFVASACGDPTDDDFEDGGGGESGGSGGSSPTGGSSGSGGEPPSETGGGAGIPGSGGAKDPMGGGGGSSGAAGGGGAGAGGAAAGEGGQAGGGGTIGAIGCASGERAGLVNRRTYPKIAACTGSWQGDVSNGVALCGNGWHVCRGDEPAMKAMTWEEGTSFDGCFAFDAAQDEGQCLPHCSSHVGTVDTAENIDMGGLGGGCIQRFHTSCISNGRIDASFNSMTGCNYAEHLSGVVCCEN
jgi:hypothetical protein